MVEAYLQVLVLIEKKTELTYCVNQCDKKKIKMIEMLV